MSDKNYLVAEPGSRKIIMILSHPEYLRMLNKGDGGLRANSSILVSDYDQIRSDPDYVNLLGELIAPDTVLMQSPYSEVMYETTSQALYTFSIAKHMIVAELLQLLGCRKIHLSQLDVVQEKKTREIEFDAKNPKVKGKYKSLNLDEKSLCKFIGLEAEYPSGKPNIEKARELLVRNKLAKDFILNSWINQRLNADNRLEKFDFKVTLSEETKHMAEHHLSVDIPAFLKLKGDIKTEEIRKTALIVTYAVEF